MKLSAIDLNLLVALDALLEVHSVTRAARQLGVTPSAMSHTLERLRDELGDPLLTRAGKGMVPTRRASALVPQVKRALAEIERVFQAPSELDPGQLDEVFRIAASDQISALLGEELDELLAREAPRVDLSFHAPREDIVPGFRAGELDLAIGVFTRLPAEMYIQSLFEERHVTVVRRDHPTIRDAASLKQFVAIPHILVSPRGGEGRVDRILAERSLSRRVARVEQTFLAALYRASRSDYLLTVPSRLASKFCDVFGLRILAPPIDIPAYVVSQIWHARDHEDPSHRWLRQTILQVARSLAPLAPLDPRAEIAAPAG